MLTPLSVDVVYECPLHHAGLRASHRFRGAMAVRVQALEDDDAGLVKTRRSYVEFLCTVCQSEHRVVVTEETL